MSKEPIIPRENAEEQLNLLLDFYEIEVEEEVLDEDEKDSKALESLEAIKRRLLKAIMYGRLEIREAPEDLEVIQHLRKPMKDGSSELHWNGVSGTAKSSIKVGDSGTGMSVMYKLCAAMTGVSATHIMALKNLDLSTSEALCNLFLLM